MELTTKRGGDEKLTKPSSATKGDEALRSAMEIEIRNRRSPMKHSGDGDEKSTKRRGDGDEALFCSLVSI